MIHTFIPYCPRGARASAYARPGADFGLAINRSFALLSDSDWGIILDHDAYLLTRWWYRRLEDAVAAEPDAGAFTVQISRGPPHCRWQVWSGAREMKGAGIVEWRRAAAALEEERKGELIDVTDRGFGDDGWAGVEAQGGGKVRLREAPISGTFLIRGSVFREIGGAMSGFRFVDYDLHARIRATGRRLYLIPSVLLYHCNRGAE